MNRNEVYNILVDAGLNTYSVVVNNRPYKKLYIPREWTLSFIHTQNIDIMDFNEVYICSDELVIRGKYEKFQVNIKYKDIETLEVGGE